MLFDVYGTLLDVYSVGLRAEQMFPGAGERLARAWRDKQIEYSRLVSMSGRYRPFWQLTRDALQVCAATLKLPLDGRRRFAGVLKSVDSDTIVMEVDGNAHSLPDLM